MPRARVSVLPLVALFLALPAARALVPLPASPADAVSVADGALFGFSPEQYPYRGGYQVDSACTGTASGTLSCEIRASVTDVWYIFGSSCVDQSDPGTCSDFTGTLRVTMRTTFGTPDNVEDLDFVHGAHHPLYWHLAGDYMVGGPVALSVKVLPLQAHVGWPDSYAIPTRVPASGGFWAVWIAQ